MSESLSDTTVAILLAPRGTEEPEFTEPREALTDAGATVDVVGVETGEVQTVNNDLEPGGSYEVEKSFSEVSADDYDGLVVPGGSVGADELRADEECVEFVWQFVEADKPTGVICHGPWVLAEADVLDGRTVTSYSSIQTDLRNAGAEWVDEEAAVDGHLVTSRNPDDLDAFCEAVVDQLAQASQ